MFASCPYCKQAMKWMEELKSENAEYAGIDVTIIDEKKQPEISDQYDYYYVPTYFIDGNKVHEGAASKEKVESVFKQFLAQG